MGGDGRQAENVVGKGSNQTLEGLQNGQANLQNSPQLQQMLSQYGSGQMSLQTALGKAQEQAAGMQGPGQGQAMSDFTNALATGAGTGSKFAAEQIAENPMSKGLFSGPDSYQNQLMNEQRGLSEQGYGLTQGDKEAYGQAAGNIARQSGQEESQLSNALASRGLSAAPSGSALMAYSGSMGNKNERLAQAQTNIANQRMQTNMQRIAQTRQALNQTIGQGQEALQNQYGRQLAGAQNQQQNALNTGNSYQNMLNARQAQNNQGFQQVESTKGPSFGDVIGGIGTGLLGAATGGLGAGLAAGIGGAVKGAIGGGGSKPQMLPGAQ